MVVPKNGFPHCAGNSKVCCKCIYARLPFPEILRQIQQLPKPVRLVVSAVTLETQAEVTQLLQDAPQLEIIPVFSGQSRKVGRYHVLQPYHPVLLFACTGGKSS